MNGLTKFLIGAAATSLLAYGAHALTGAEYIDGLEQGGSAALEAEGIGDVSLSMATDPLARVAVLSGPTDPEARAKAEAAALSVPGIASVRWADDGDVAATPEPANTADGMTASEEEIASCQDNLDGIMEGKVINFATGSATIDPAGITVVDEIAAALGDCDGMAIMVEGHSDATGNADFNRNLSQQRAGSVAAALIERGLAEDRVSSQGFGADQPIMEGTSAAANAANRRIEFTLSGTATDGEE